MTDREVERGARIYSKPVLNIYDILVIRFANSFAWRCPSVRMLEQYNELIGARHLDVGPGTGWYLARSNFAPDAAVTLMDLNANSLESASAQLSGMTPAHVVGNALEPLPSGVGPFDSIAANYLFHCMPGTWSEKGVAVSHLAKALAPDGVFFGATILGQDVRHNALGRGFMKLYNRIGVFHNVDDDLAGLHAVLSANFENVDVQVHNTVAMFRASRPIQ